MLAAQALSARATEPSTFAAGVNVLGGQFDYQPVPTLRLEARALTGKNGSGSDRVSSSVIGLRGYRIFKPQAATRPYLGVEGAYLTSRSSGGTYRAAGTAFGGFAGLERRLASRVWVGVDAGPYLFALKETTTRVSQTSLEFVANSFVMVYLF